MNDDAIDQIRDLIADIATTIDTQSYGSLLIELLAEAAGWRVLLEEYTNTGDYVPEREWPSDLDLFDEDAW
jgi:hypothetical protein